jgi:methylthioribose-1-phosphate isomerase
LDLSLKSGDEIPIEERHAKEVTHLNGFPVAPEGIRVRNPAFDVTPAEYIHAIITEKGVITGDFRKNLGALVKK